MEVKAGTVSNSRVYLATNVERLMIAKELRLEGADCFVWRGACTQLCAGGARVAKCFAEKKACTQFKVNAVLGC